jgi:hypothetical protein
MDQNTLLKIKAMKQRLERNVNIHRFYETFLMDDY